MTVAVRVVPYVGATRVVPREICSRPLDGRGRFSFRWNVTELAETASK
jgi:hypothetical protein